MEMRAVKEWASVCSSSLEDWTLLSQPAGTRDEEIDMPRVLKLPKYMILFFALVFLLFIVACSEDEADTPPVDVDPIERGADIPIVIPAGEPIVIGISTALTGGPTGDRGEEYRDAAIVAVERWKQQNSLLIGGHEIVVHAEDDGCSDTEITTRAAGHMLRGEDGHQQLPGLVGVLGPQCSGGVVAVMDDYAEAGIVMISGSATTTSLTDSQGDDGFFFRTAYRNDLEGTLIGLFAATNEDLGIDSAVIVDNSGTYGVDLAINAARVSEEFGLTVDRLSITEGTVDFGPTVQEIIALDPSFVAFMGFNPEAGLLYRQLRDEGYTGIFGAGDGAASVTGFVEPVGIAESEGVLFGGCTVPLPKVFLDDFEELHGHTPTASFPAQYADAATILLNAIAAVAEEQTDGSLVIEPTELRDKIRETATSGISGSIGFDEHGDRLPPGVNSLEDFVNEALIEQDASVFVDLGLIPCQVQDGVLVNLFGPGAGERR
jgi:ABC-type branched-subunit amino acid transport system substrate-binding protein